MTQKQLQNKIKEWREEAHHMKTNFLQTKGDKCEPAKTTTNAKKLHWLKTDWKKDFKKTKFAQNGGACFECCDYEEMYADMITFISNLLKAGRGVSAWKREGIKYGYWDYFKKAERKEIVAMLEDILEKHRHEQSGITLEEKLFDFIKKLK